MCNNGICNILGIFKEDKLIGFMITNRIKHNKYLQLDYFAIFPEYQSKGYGKQAIKKLKEISKDYYGIFIEVEKLGLGKDNEENIQRERRVKFYKELGFVKLEHDLELYKVIYSPYILFCDTIVEEDDKIINNLFNIYKEIMGEKRTNKNCKVLIDI